MSSSNENAKTFITIEELQNQLSLLITENLEIICNVDYVHIQTKPRTSQDIIVFNIFGNVIFYGNDNILREFIKLLIDCNKIIYWNWDEKKGYYRSHDLQEAKLNMLEREIENLKNEIEDLRHDGGYSTDDISKIESKLEEVADDCSALTSRVDDLENREGDPEEMSRDISNLSDRIDDLEEWDFLKMSDNLENLESNVEALESTTETLKETVNDLESTVNNKISEILERLTQYENGLFSGLGKTYNA